MMRQLSAFVAFLLGAALFFAGGFSFIYAGSLMLTTIGLFACIFGSFFCFRAGKSNDGRTRFFLSLLWQDCGSVIVSVGLGSLLFLYNKGILPLIGFSAASMFILQAIVTQCAGQIVKSYRGWLLTLSAVSGMPLTLGAAANWQMLQGWMTLPEVEPSAWVKLLLAVVYSVISVCWVLRLLGEVLFYQNLRQTNDVLSKTLASDTAVTGAKVTASEVSVDAGSSAGSFLSFTEVIFPLLIFGLGIYPAPVIEAVQQVLINDGRKIRFADSWGMIWGGSGHYALYSPLLLALFLALLCFFVYALERWRQREAKL